jgi:hypothetical protein
MRVLFLQRQPCIRTMKYAIGLHAGVPGVRLGFAYQGRTLTSWYGAGDELFERWWRLPAADPRQALAAVVAEFRPDLIHSHNLPDVLTVLALDVADGRLPVIHDAHDMQSLRATPYEDGFDDPEHQDVLERDAVEGCAALIAVSEEMREELAARYTLPARTLLFANYALSRDIAQAIPPGRSHDGPLRVAYQGSLSVNGSHYDLRDHFRAVGEAGLLLDVYPNREVPAYRELAGTVPGMRLMGSLAPADLMRALPAYDVGWAVFNPLLNAAHMDTALPNKAYEYLASGLPIAAGPHAALRRLVREHEVGVAIDHASELEPCVKEAGLARLRERVRDRRRLFTVEAHIGSLVELYAEVAAAAVPA